MAVGAALRGFAAMPVLGWSSVWTSYCSTQSIQLPVGGHVFTGRYRVDKQSKGLDATSLSDGTIIGSTAATSHDANCWKCTQRGPVTHLQVNTCRVKLARNGSAWQGVPHTCLGPGQFSGWPELARLGAFRLIEAQRIRRWVATGWGGCPGCRRALTAETTINRDRYPFVARRGGTNSTEPNRRRSSDSLRTLKSTAPPLGCYAAYRRASS
jgi:hypothetical protein